MPYVFTEQGIAMLSGLLKNKIAVKVSINIIKVMKKIDNYQLIVYNNVYIREMNYFGKWIHII